MINPYFTYAAAFLFSILVYQLNWSGLYPPLSPALLIFLFATSLFAIFLGFIAKKKNTLDASVIDRPVSLSTLIKITCACYLIWSLEFAFSNYIPLVEILRGDFYAHTDFTGIPSLHTIIYTFQEFICVYILHSYFANKNKSYLYLYAFNLLPFVAIFSRAALIFIIMSNLLIYMSIIQNKINFASMAKNILLKLLPFFLIGSFMFGLLGDLRSTSQLGGNTDAGNDLALTIGEATPSFYQSGAPKEMYWLYLYASSPLANLQENINVVSDKYQPLELMNFIPFTVNELLPDFISKRIIDVFNMKKTSNYLISPVLTVSTIYSGSFTHLQWLGMLFMFALLIYFPIAYSSTIAQNSQFYVSGIAMLSSLYFLLIFDNMIAFSGTSLTIVYPIVFARIFDINKEKNEFLKS